MLKVGSIVIRVDDLERQTQFWQEALGYERRIEESDVFAHLYPKDGHGPDVSLDALPSEAPTPLPNHRRPSFYERKLAEGKTRKEAIQALKRRISDVVYRHLSADQNK